LVLTLPSGGLFVFFEVTHIHRQLRECSGIPQGGWGAESLRFAMGRWGGMPRMELVVDAIKKEIDAFVLINI